MGSDQDDHQHLHDHPHAMRGTPLIAVAALLVACSGSPASDLNAELADREDAVPSCAATDCTAEVAVLASALGQLPGVVQVTDATYQPEQATDGAWVRGALVVADGVSCDDLEERAAELGWQSPVSPLGTLDFDCSTADPTAGGGRRGYLHTAVRPTSQAQLDTWGDRGTLDGAASVSVSDIRSTSAGDLESLASVVPRSGFDGYPAPKRLANREFDGVECYAFDTSNKEYHRYLVGVSTTASTSASTSRCRWSGLTATT